MLEEAFKFIKQLRKFQYQLIADPTWHIVFSNDKKKWHHLKVTYCDGVYYIFDLINSYSIGLDPINHSIEPFKEQSSSTKVITLKNWIAIFKLANNWLDKVAKDWIAANTLVQKNYPAIYKTGTVSSAIVKNYFPEYQMLNKKLGANNSKLFCTLVTTKKINENDISVVEKLCANTYFEYCKIAYNSIGLNPKNISGRKLYEIYSENGHNGLLDIDPASEQEFAQWIDGKHPKKTTGGHPWEIIRGGNLSNIQLNVRRPLYNSKSKFVIEIFPSGYRRLAETIKMFLAIHKAGLAINIVNAEFIRQQLLSLDNFGIIPEYESLHRANQQLFKVEKISEVLYFNAIKKQQVKILPFISWKALPILLPTS